MVLWSWARSVKVTSCSRCLLCWRERASGACCWGPRGPDRGTTPPLRWFTAGETHLWRSWRPRWLNVCALSASPPESEEHTMHAGDKRTRGQEDKRTETVSGQKFHYITGPGSDLSPWLKYRCFPRNICSWPEQQAASTVPWGRDTLQFHVALWTDRVWCHRSMLTFIVQQVYEEVNWMMWWFFLLGSGSSNGESTDGNNRWHIWIVEHCCPLMDKTGKTHLCLGGLGSVAVLVLTEAKWRVYRLKHHVRRPCWTFGFVLIHLTMQSGGAEAPGLLQRRKLWRNKSTFCKTGLIFCFVLKVQPDRNTSWRVGRTFSI